MAIRCYHCYPSFSAGIHGFWYCILHVDTAVDVYRECLFCKAKGSVFAPSNLIPGPPTTPPHTWGFLASLVNVRVACSACETNWWRHDAIRSRETIPCTSKSNHIHWVWSWLIWWGEFFAHSSQNFNFIHFAIPPTPNHHPIRPYPPHGCWQLGTMKHPWVPSFDLVHQILFDSFTLGSPDPSSRQQLKRPRAWAQPWRHRVI